MTIKVGDRLPAGSLSEYIEVETEGCTLGPNEFKIDEVECLIVSEKDVLAVVGTNGKSKK